MLLKLATLKSALFAFKYLGLFKSNPLITTFVSVESAMFTLLIEPLAIFTVFTFRLLNEPSPFTIVEFIISVLSIWPFTASIFSMWGFAKTVLLIDATFNTFTSKIFVFTFLALMSLI